MTLQIYPSTPKPNYSYLLDHQLKTEVVDFESGTEQRNRRWRFSRRTFQLLYKMKSFTATQRDAISDFYYQRYGSYELFWFFDIQSRRWIDQYVGRGDGVTQTFDIPGLLLLGPTLVEVGAILAEGGVDDGKYITTEDDKHLIGDGFTITGTSPFDIYVNGVVTTNFNFSTGTGLAGVDQVIFGDTPIAGSLITIDFTGYLRIKARFKDDRFTEEIFTTHLDNLAVNIYEVKN